jgi:hypothetical protein
MRISSKRLQPEQAKKDNVRRELDSNQRPSDPRESVLGYQVKRVGKADRSLGYQIGCADHCTTTAIFFLVDGTLMILTYKGRAMSTRCYLHVETQARIALTGSASFALSNSIALALEISKCSACEAIA